MASAVASHTSGVVFQYINMSKHLIYRPGSAKDVKQLKELSLASYGQYANVLTPENWHKLNTNLNNEQIFIELINKSNSFVCLDQDKMVGMAFLLPSGNPTDIFEKEWSYIRMVGVHPDYAGQGIARTLTEKCIEKAKELNEKIIALHTSEFMDAARHLYESMGFKVLKEIPDRLGKKYWLYTLNI
jgi:ribosomal protein S18 acetylase RimI-like enzyme